MDTLWRTTLLTWPRLNQMQQVQGDNAQLLQALAKLEHSSDEINQRALARGGNVKREVGRSMTEAWCGYHNRAKVT